MNLFCIIEVKQNQIRIIGVKQEYVTSLPVYIGIVFLVDLQEELQCQILSNFDQSD